jgi:L-fuconolactonase
MNRKLTSLAAFYLLALLPFSGCETTTAGDSSGGAGSGNKRGGKGNGGITRNTTATTRANPGKDIPIIDTHIHLYDTARKGGVPWPPATDKVLYRPVLTGDYDKVAEENNIAATVVVEASDLVEDNQWVLDLTKGNPKRYIAVVGNLPVGAEEFAGLVERFSKDPRFVGIRLRQRPAGNFFNDNTWRDLELLGEKGLVLDVLLADFNLAEVSLIAKRVPKLKILANHLTGLTITPLSPENSWAEEVVKLAANPNVYCKVSGIFQRSGQIPAPKDLGYYEKVFKVVYDAFGEDRVIYGSNWPVTDRGGEYHEQLSIIHYYFKKKGKRVMEKLYYKNAEAFYGISLSAN